ncbi:hypothetical protein H257_03311 [Aphanomyces astaci]|uniref:Uncharacterized protein n=1 Tax=Aphanomyces astaci TaxID=112090 RepID=W4H0U3_APHAT|nr:hypothetical protein H257_03311 [Aphanomyces astaci]ETV85605.1 hypothetical protein H257_03311 [Aphanomyces astaci]|eukprot:XP_009825623.1 hypothetical protein H257_03311 [Aphanomyces astaci]
MALPRRTASRRCGHAWNTIVHHKAHFHGDSRRAHDRRGGTRTELAFSGGGGRDTATDDALTLSGLQLDIPPVARLSTDGSPITLGHHGRPTLGRRTPSRWPLQSTPSLSLPWGLVCCCHLPSGMQHYEKPMIMHCPVISAMHTLLSGCGAVFGGRVWPAPHGYELLPAKTVGRANPNSRGWCHRYLRWRLAT